LLPPFFFFYSYKRGKQLDDIIDQLYYQIEWGYGFISYLDSIILYNVVYTAWRKTRGTAAENLNQRKDVAITGL